MLESDSHRPNRACCHTGSVSERGTRYVPGPDVSGNWAGTSELTGVTGGECAGDVYRSAVSERLGRQMTIGQTGSQLTVTLSRGRMTVGDSTWSGSVDATGRITATWQAQVGSNSLSFICEPRNASATRNVVVRSAIALLSRGSASKIEGTVITRYQVTTLFGTPYPDLSETTTERFTKQ